MKLSVVSGLSVSALTITKNTDGHCYYSHSLCVLVHLMESGKMSLLLHPYNIDHHKSCWSSNNKMEHKEFQKFLPPRNKNTRVLASETEGPIKGIEMRKKIKKTNRKNML